MSHIDRRNFVASSAAAALGTALCQGITPSNVQAADPPVFAPPGIKTFSRMPKTVTEVAHQHMQSANQGIEFLPKGQPLELNSYALALTQRDTREFGKAAKKPNPSTRRFVLSVGIQVGEEDKAKLPSLSAATILDYLSNHYVSVQARIQKNEKGVLYLHQRPIVATAKFGKVRITEEFTPAVTNSVKDMHSLGMFVPGKLAPTPENLRTMVLVHKHTALDVKTGRVEPHFEFVFIRGRQNSIGNKLDLHCFTTSEERTKLHYLKPATPPLRFTDCTLKASVYFSRYTGGDLIPADSVMRSQTVNSKSVFLMTDLDAFVRNSLRLTGDALTNLNETLDAVIDGKIRPGPASSPRAAMQATSTTIAPGAAKPQTK